MTSLPETRAGKPRVEWMDALRGMAIVLVVLDHSIYYIHEGGFTDLAVIDKVSDMLNPVRMPAMAFLSGLLLAPSLRKGARTYLWGKVDNVVWPFLVWAVIYKLVWIAAVPLTGTPHHLSDLLAIAWAPPGHLWYLRDLFAFYVLHLALSRVSLPRTPMLFCAAAAAILLAALQETGFNNGQGERFFFLFAFFTLGGWLSDHPDRFEAILRNPWARTAASAFAVATVPATLAWGNMRYEWESTPFTTGAIGLLALTAQGLCRTPLSAGLRFLGRNSLMVYVGHWLIVAVSAMLVTRYAADLNPTVMAIFVLVAGIGFSVAGIHLVRQVPALDALFSFPRRRPRKQGRAAPGSASGAPGRP
jgi:uncharacterized membrane protein YcfT